MASSKVMPSTSASSSDVRSQQQQQQQQQQQKQRLVCDRSGGSGGCGGRSDGLASTMAEEGIDVYDPLAESTLLDSTIGVMEAPAPATAGGGRSVDDVWREIVAGERKEVMKEEAPDEMMTLEDFLVKAGAVEDATLEEEMDVKVAEVAQERLSGGVFAFDPLPASSFQMLDKVEGSIVGYANGMDVYGSGGGGGGRGKRARLTMEPLDKAAAQRQRRMIKNRESAARSRERKQAYQVELESLAARLEEENERLSKEKAERTKERYKKLMEKVIPVVEKQRTPRLLRRIRSLEW